jgi:hypothetical protein
VGRVPSRGGGVMTVVVGLVGATDTVGELVNVGGVSTGAGGATGALVTGNEGFRGGDIAVTTGVVDGTCSPVELAGEFAGTDTEVGACVVGA